MKNLKVLFVLCLIFSAIFSSVAFSSSDEKKQSNEKKEDIIELNATNETGKKFKKITLVIKDEDTYEIHLNDEKASNGIEGYDIEVDIENKTYKAEKMNKMELDSYIEPTIHETKPENELFNENELFSISNTSTKVGWIEVTAITRDPVLVPLNQTRQRLNWYYDGNRAWQNSRNGGCTAYAPTALGTNWYTSSCQWGSYSVIDGGRTVISNLSAAYYNWDFGSNNKRTDVSHNIYLEGYRTGSSNYNTTWTKSGEGSFLLNLRVVVNKG
ncbi:hypothetical protein [Caldalkalibacillus mannanilyticus]|uniref:hypothetical protein n=1 Tax=Caldalkalibacillus mannanilyticus TaxID=1418 RepID=UPI000469CC52|nr:hypothetical protein [Caldalkalibacillus mannanilyticus]